MKKLFITLIVMVFSFSLHAEEISQEAAMNFIRYYVEANNDVDIYQAVSLNSSQNTNDWFIFVDQEPTKEWEHRCAIYSVSKIKPAISLFPVFAKTEYTMPPSELYSFTPAYVRNRDFTSPQHEVVVPTSNVTNPEAANTYAVIINSQKDPSSYKERSWNNCSYAYQTLVKKYRIPKSHILLFTPNNGPGIPIMQASDGSGLCLPSRDFDQDGTDDDVINLSDTDDWYLRYYLPDIVPANAHVIIYITGAGGKDEQGPYYYQWDNRKFYASDFAFYLDNLPTRYFSIILDINHAADYIPYFNSDRTVVMASCGSDEQAVSMSDRPYNTFTYNVMNALINGTTMGMTDSNNDSHVSMHEAYDYASSNNGNMNASYHSQSHRMGEKLCLDMIDGSELYMRDTYEDDGMEPSKSMLSIHPWWNSPDIFLRNQPDGYIHQKGEQLALSAPNQHAYLYVRIHNRGSRTYWGHGLYLHMYYANALYGLIGDIYRGREVVSSGDVPGDHTFIDMIRDTIGPGESVLKQIEWSVPLPLYYNSLENHGAAAVSFLMRISDNATDSYEFQTIDNMGVEVRYDNEIAMENILKYEHRADTVPEINLYTTHPGRMFSYELVQDPDSPNIIDNAKVCVKLSNSLYNSWQSNGGHGVGIVQSATNPSILKMITGTSKIQRLSADSSVDSIRVFCEFNNNNVSEEETYLFHIVQRNLETGNIVGGAAFEIVRHPSASYIQKHAEDSTPSISSLLSSSYGDITIQLAEPARNDCDVEIISSADSGKKTKGVIKEGSSSISLKRAGTGMNIVRLVKDGKVIDTAKINK